MTTASMASWSVTDDNADQIAEAISVALAVKFGAVIDDELDIIEVPEAQFKLDASRFTGAIRDCDSEEQLRLQRSMCDIFVARPEMINLIDVPVLEKFLSANVLQGKKGVSYCALVFGIILCSRLQTISLGSTGVDVKFEHGLPFSLTELITATSRVLPEIDRIVAHLPPASSNTSSTLSPSGS